ncbi:DNA recombination protein RmuC [Enterobacteriaceae endosymbiont of Donacia tomentosa]|uniref:DNA recombination protein RmuC n=1 Tax=Enterobacteriaceae endosymbiont of Donacia tomentosa TaxID=2675787 RepID=UPI0014493C0D|nr:DNA recombination protein RmuC [Enterobacteriaceae endosymbiont of Donacia tomentosa]QJC31719.1 DNA recombination protein RmuC [Enterobacteriaceae endosymbiont of Donacia tomentosa]
MFFLKNTIFIILLLIELFFFIIIFFFVKKNQKNIFKKYLITENENKQLEIQLARQKEQIEYLKSVKIENENLSNTILKQLAIISDLKLKIREVTTKLDDTIIFFNKKEKLITNNDLFLKTKFENLTNNILEKSETRIHNYNKQNIKNIINPFKKQLEFFHNQLQNNLNQESLDRKILTYEINSLKKLNMNISQEAVNLTNALKGNNKIQGIWGELILKKILDSSGLRKGYEYEMQKIIKTSEEKKIQPDIIINLPNSKKIIIDSKMTLIAYERYFNTNDEKKREKALNDHILAISNHLRLLSNKNYQNLSDIKTLDYVIMFIPIESAFSLAMNTKPSLLYKALKLNIMLASPTTLMIALRTINNLWNEKKQNKNSLLIAHKATKLYDKIKLFIDDMYIFEKNLNKLQNNYNLIIKKLCTGRGNIVSQAENFRNLGIKVVNKINQNIIKKN